MPAVAWSVAWDRALLGPGGFYRSQWPGDHFRTPSSYSTVLGEALADLLGQVDAALGQPARLDLVDVGAGDGGLLAGILAALDRGGSGRPDATRVQAVAVDVRTRPLGLDQRVRWVRGRAPQVLAATFPAGVRGLLLAVEWLDGMPCDVSVHDGRSWRLVLVDPATGRESLGPALQDAPACAAVGADGPAALSWARRWGPTGTGQWCEIGLLRDHAWAAAMALLRAGTAVAVDYATDAPGRDPAAGGPADLPPTQQPRTPGRTLTAYRRGRRVPAVPDGSCDLTAHVRMAAVAEAARQARTATRTATSLTTQRRALLDLGLTGRTAGAPLPALVRDGAVATLLDPAGLGGFAWLIQGTVPGGAPSGPDRDARGGDLGTVPG